MGLRPAREATWDPGEAGGVGWVRKRSVGRVLICPDCERPPSHPHVLLIAFLKRHCLGRDPIRLHAWNWSGEIPWVPASPPHPSSLHMGPVV